MVMRGGQGDIPPLRLTPILRCACEQITGWIVTDRLTGRWGCVETRWACVCPR